MGPGRIMSLKFVFSQAAPPAFYSPCREKLRADGLLGLSQLQSSGHSASPPQIDLRSRYQSAATPNSRQGHVGVCMCAAQAWVPGHESLPGRPLANYVPLGMWEMLSFRASNDCQVHLSLGGWASHVCVCVIY